MIDVFTIGLLTAEFGQVWAKLLDMRPLDDVNEVSLSVKLLRNQ